MRVTQKRLEELIFALNVKYDLPTKPYEKVGDEYVAQKGNMHLDYAYGAYAVDQFCYDNSSAVHQIISRRSGRELYEFLSGALFTPRLTKEDI